jgi:hypothetical protein
LFEKVDCLLDLIAKNPTLFYQVPPPAANCLVLLMYWEQQFPPVARCWLGHLLVVMVQC